MDIRLSSEQKNLYQILEKTDDHVFVTGKAGTGKSALLEYFKDHTDKKIVVVAPTGVAALNVGGQTIHSLFGIPPRFINKESLKITKRAANLLKNIDAVVIDEVSMVRADLMDAIDSLLRQATLDQRTFGGVQMIMFGDLFQLPPIVTPDLQNHFREVYDGQYFFNAHCFLETHMMIYELSEVFRQSDPTFIKILNEMREGSIGADTLEILNTRYVNEFPESEVVTLATTNKIVDSINTRMLEQIPDRPYEFEANVKGNISQSSFPTDEKLRLKVGAQVMFLRNDSDKRWVNGTMGVVEELKQRSVRVRINHTVHDVDKETWENVKYSFNEKTQEVEEEVVSSFTQFPLRLAWAVTIHKSQGQTFEKVILNMGSHAFAHGQTYVGLSRCKSLEGLYLRRPINRNDTLVDPQIVKFMQDANIVDADS